MQPQGSVPALLSSEALCLPWPLCDSGCGVLTSASCLVTSTQFQGGPCRAAGWWRDSHGAVTAWTEHTQTMACCPGKGTASVRPALTARRKCLSAPVSLGPSLRTTGCKYLRHSVMGYVHPGVFSLPPLKLTVGCTLLGLHGDTLPPRPLGPWEQRLCPASPLCSQAPATSPAPGSPMLLLPVITALESRASFTEQNARKVLPRH